MNSSSGGLQRMRVPCSAGQVEDWDGWGRYWLMGCDVSDRNFQPDDNDEPEPLK